MTLCDWHIHTRRSPCGHQEATYADVAARARALGIRCFGFTDHLHCHVNLPQLRLAREEFDALPEGTGAHFGLEVSCLRVWDIEQNEAAGDQAHVYGLWEGGPVDSALTIYWSKEVEALRPEYVIGGAHWPLGVPLERDAVIRSYHRQNMYLAQHPRVTVVAHPWWWQGAWQAEDGTYPDLPWLGDFGVVPASMHEEFATALCENGKYMELNASAIFLNPHYPPRFVSQYLEYAAFMKSMGVRFALGSDSHERVYEPLVEKMMEVLATLGLTEADLWQGPATAPEPQRLPRGL